VNFREFCSKVSEILNEMCPYLFVMIWICFFNFVISKVRRFFFTIVQCFLDLQFLEGKKSQKEFFSQCKISPPNPPPPFSQKKNKKKWS